MSNATKSRLGRGLSSLIGAPVAVRVPDTVEASSVDNYDAPAAADQVQRAAQPIAAPVAQSRVGAEFDTPTNAVVVSAGSEPESERVPEPAGSPRLRQLGLDAIVPNPYQPRREIDEQGVATLAESIRTAGVMQPVAVRRISSVAAAANLGAGDAKPEFELVAGERRWRAARLAGLATIPAVIVEIDDRTSAEWALIENLQREDLDPMERGWAFRNLAEKFGLSQAEVGERVGIERSTVANLIRLTELEPELQRFISDGKLSPGHAKVLLGLPAGETRSRVAQRVMKENWSVRRLEQWIAQTAKAALGAKPVQSASGMIKDAAAEAGLREIEKQLGEHLGTRVRIGVDGTGQKGKLVVEFFDLEHFDGVMQAMGFSLKS